MGLELVMPEAGGGRTAGAAASAGGGGGGAGGGGAGGWGKDAAGFRVDVSLEEIGDAEGVEMGMVMRRWCREI